MKLSNKKNVSGNNLLKPKFPAIKLNRDEYILYCFTDGACEGNGKEQNRGGYAYIFVDEHDISCGTQFQVSTVNTSNNKMELGAVIDALKWVKANMSDTQVLIHIDSQYVIHGLGTWYKGWIKRDWVDVKNKELWQELLVLKDQLPKVQYKWVAAHQENPLKKKAYHQNSEFETRWNMYVDQLAVEACTGKREEDKVSRKVSMQDDPEQLEDYSVKSKYPETINITEEEMQDMQSRGDKSLKVSSKQWEEWPDDSPIMELSKRLIETSSELERLKGIVRAYMNLGEGYRKDELEAEIKALI